MSTPLSKGHRRNYVYALLILLILLFLFGCTNVLNPQQTDVELPTLKTERVEGQPWENLLPQLDPELQAILLDFSENAVPEVLPELAFPNAFFFKPYTATMENDLIVSLAGEYASIDIVVANPGSNFNQANLLCFRNGVKVACTPDVDVWQIYQPPLTMNFIPTKIESEAGDQLTFLMMPEREAERVMIGSGMKWIFVEEQPSSSPAISVNAPPHEPVLGGCDIANFVTDTTPSNTYQIPGEQKRGVPLFFLLQLCEPPENIYWQLVPIVDRLHVAPLEDEVWQQPIQQVSQNLLIPINTQEVGNVTEFQVAVIPLTEEARAIMQQRRFTNAVNLVD